MVSDAQRIFEEALDLPAPERAAFLADRCAGNPALQRDVESLFSAHRDAGPFLSEPTIVPAPNNVPTELLADTPTPGDPEPRDSSDLGDRYTILHLLGQGGFGKVFLADQHHPVARRVAIKLIRRGFDTSSIVARFEAERQTLAVMNHDCIARVFDAGATPSGQPYFVMEFVDGIPITRYCDQHAIPVRDRLRLFIRLCSGVQHAHQKGVIHRDLKPSNILVIHAEEPVPKIIDFGIAKATALPPTADPLTLHGHLVGTPAYMSPEQADGLSDIDTRTDIYALGVVLYELLTGETPLSVNDQATGFADFQRLIREKDPPRPSSRLAHSRTGTTRGELAGLLRDDLDWIVLKCLEKDRERRYPSAQALADDIQRSLHDEPISAGPPSVAYRLRKFARRHKAAALILVAVVGGLAGTSSGLVAAFRSMRTAQAARERAHAAELGATSIARELGAALPPLLATVASEPDGSLIRADATRLLRDRLVWVNSHLHEVSEEAEIQLRANIMAGLLLLGLPHEADLVFDDAGRSFRLDPEQVTAALSQVIDTIIAHGATLSTLGRVSHAERAFTACVQRLARAVPDPAQRTRLYLRLAGTKYYQNNTSAAENLLADARAILESTTPPASDAELARVLDNLAAAQLTRLARAQADLELPISNYRRALDLRQHLAPRDDSLVARSHAGLARALLLKGVQLRREGRTAEERNAFAECNTHLQQALDITARLGSEGELGLQRAHALGLAITCSLNIRGNTDGLRQMADEAGRIALELIPAGNPGAVQTLLTVASVYRQTDPRRSLDLLLHADAACARHPEWDPTQRILLKSNILALLRSEPHPDRDAILAHAEQLVAHQRDTYPIGLWLPEQRLTLNSGLVVLCGAQLQQNTPDSLAAAQLNARECLRLRAQQTGADIPWLLADGEYQLARILLARFELAADTLAPDSSPEPALLDLLRDAQAALARAKGHRILAQTFSATPSLEPPAGPPPCLTTLSQDLDTLEPRLARHLTHWIP